jgi:hypothetical protein
MNKGRPPKQRTPHEKKAASYKRDCRNSYGENDKASRRLIPLRKATSQRRLRRVVKQAFSILALVDEPRADLVESNARKDVRRVEAWRKAPDTPLGDIVARQPEVRESRNGAKIPRKEKWATAPRETPEPAGSPPSPRRR